jgi:sucrose-6-phosphate hydrolase SacC (GH32 family)
MHKRCRFQLVFPVVLGIAVLVAGWRAHAEAEDVDGFKDLFDGKTLDGWKAADMSYWSVEGGAITGKITKEHPLKENLYLIWQGGELGDFEIKMKHRLSGSPGINGGFQFRSKELPNHDVAGYQMDNNLNTDWLVRLYDEHGRETLALRGQRVVFDEQGRAQRTRIPEAEGAAWFKLEEWHEYHLICEGPRLTLKVDGRLAAEVVDNDPKQQDFSGILGLQLHSGPPTTAQFKDIRMKILKPAAAAPKTPAAVKPSASEPAGAADLRDKTLVAWVAPANLTQRGGSVLTIDDQDSHFDGIVFGELAPAKWMAGSDFFRRTQKDQAKCPTETADPNTLVQVAIVYRGNQVTVYRNGKEYAHHEITQPQAFGPDSAVVIGLRHIEAGDRACFAGAIDDARIYDVALSAEQIAALKPNESSDPKPWAWWSFDDKEARDRTGRFPVTQLVGGATVEGGKLLLDGKTGMMLCKTGKESPIAYETPARPENPPANWLTFHLTHPGPGGAMPGDPNCAFYWKGRYHLHYIYNHKKGFAFAHVSSEDLLHWTWHQTTLNPKTTGHGMFSGTGFITKEGQPAIIYHGQGSGRNQLAFALDDKLEEWTKPVAIMPRDASGQEPKMNHWDPDCWLNGDTYYAISGGGNPSLMKSSDLKDWRFLGPLLHDDYPANLGVPKGEDISCANMFKIGRKWMLLCISHGLGCRYYLGDFKDEKYLPDFHALMSWNGNNFFAPESVLTKDGRRVMWAWLLNLPIAPSGVQSLPREMELPGDGVLRIRPLRELESLRYDRKQEDGITVKSDSARRIEGIGGDALELGVAFKSPTAKELGMDVLCDKDGENGLRIAYVAESKTLRAGKVSAPLALKEGEDLSLRVFIDKNLVEVFANDRQAAVAAHKYEPGNVGVSLFSKGGDAVVKEVKSWKMKSIYEGK